MHLILHTLDRNEMKAALGYQPESIVQNYIQTARRPDRSLPAANTSEPLQNAKTGWIKWRKGDDILVTSKAVHWWFILSKYASLFVTFRSSYLPFLNKLDTSNVPDICAPMIILGVSD